jgi:hypothetical protein
MSITLEMKARCYGNVAGLASVAQDIRDQISMVICKRDVLAHGSLKIGRAANRTRLHRSRANFRFCHPRIVPQGAWGCLFNPGQPALVDQQRT